MSQAPLPIGLLVESRAKTLGLRSSDVVRRAGYANVAKGLRRLSSLQEGNVSGNQGLIVGLSAALQVPPEDVQAAVAATQRQLREAEEAAWGSAFKPHALITTANSIPQPIVVAAILGVERLLRIDFDLAASPITFAIQVREGVCQMLARWKSRTIPAFGAATGFVVNYSPDRAVAYDLDGTPIQEFVEAQRPFGARLSIGKRFLSDGELGAMFRR